MSGEKARTDDTENALGNTGTEEPKQEHSDVNQVLVKKSYSILFRCIFCEFSHSENSAIRIHLRTHSEPKMLECTDCQESFSSLTDIFYHFKHHPKEDKNCPKCSKKFQSVITLGKHLQSHQYIKWFICRRCGYESKDLSNIYRHFKKHKEGPANPFGEGTSSSSEQQFSSSPATGEHSHTEREVENVAKRRRKSETSSCPAKAEVPDSPSTSMTITGCESERGSGPSETPGSSSELLP